MMPIKKTNLPPEVAQLLSGGLIDKIEYAGDSIYIVLKTKEFFRKVLEGSGMSLIEVTDEKIVIRMPIEMFNE